MQSQASALYARYLCSALSQKCNGLLPELELLDFSTCCLRERFQRAQKEDILRNYTQVKHQLGLYGNFEDDRRPAANDGKDAAVPRSGL